MRIDEAIKRSYVVIVCFLIGAAAYFQVSGLMSLARGVIAGGTPLEGERGASGGGRGKTIKPSATSARETSAAAILARNPFDSVTGPLDGSGEPPEQPAAPEDDGAPCAGVRVVLISASDDPGFSFAAIAEGAQKPILRRMGDMIAGYAVDAIVRDRVRLASGVRSCIAALGEKPTAAAAGPAKGLEKPLAAGRDPGALPQDIASKIRVISDREVEVDRSVIATVMERQGEIFGRVRVTPEKDGGGLRVMGIRPGSLLGTLGMENGDKLQSINGINVADPRSAMEAYMRLERADHLVVSVVRRGQPMNIDVKIK
jgi:general secretion pathway protein C